MAQKKLFLNLLYSRKALALLRLLFKEGLISNYFIFKKNKKKLLKIFPAYYKNIAISNCFRIISTPSRTFFISHYALTLLNKRTGSSTYFLSTSKGIITHHTAINKKIGGVLIGFSAN